MSESEEGRRKAFLPGSRFDAHVHIFQAEGLRDVSTAGVAGVRDAGSRSGAGLLAGASCSGREGVRCYSAGWALCKKGGYGAAFGMAVENLDEAKGEILKLKKAGAAIIKVMVSGIVSLKEQGVVTAGGFDRDELAELVQEAGSRGLGVMAHANGEQAIIAAAEAGVRSIEHGFFMTPRALAAVAKAGAVWTPTVGALERAALAKELPRAMREYISGLIFSHLDMIRRACEAGVRLAIGTDCVLPDPGYGLAYEAELLSFERAGLSRDTVRAIAAGTGELLPGGK